MSVDRYIAVCHSFSKNLKKLRYDRAASFITIVIWVVSVLLCIPIAIYSTKTGTEPNCKCQLVFNLLVYVFNLQDFETVKCRVSKLRVIAS